MKTFEQSEASRYSKAKEKVSKLRDFYSHFTIYLIFIPFFIFLNVMSSGFPWAIFPIFGWGIGVLIHAAETFSWNPFFDRHWEERKIREFMDQENGEY